MTIFSENTVSKRLRVSGMTLRVLFFIAAMLTVTWLPACAADSPGHPETIAVLKELYQNEITAHHTYAAFARKAEAEGYVSVASVAGLISLLIEAGNSLFHTVKSVPWRCQAMKQPIV